MTTTFTSILGLKLSTDFTDELNFNFNKIDLLGSVYQTDVSGSITVRSKTDINFEPNSSDLGGTGSGGTLTFASQTSPATSFDVYADAVDFHGAPITGLSLDWDDVNNKTANTLPDLTAFIGAHSDVVASLAHTTATSNPHSVTASETGAYTSGETDSLLATKEALGATSTHAALTTTHGVTGSLVGTTDTQALTNKTISATNNSLSGITHAHMNLGSTVIPYSSTDLSGSILLTDLDAGFSLPWSSVNKSGSNLSDLSTKNHSDLTGAGTYAHTQIDTHIDATSAAHGIAGQFVGTTDTQLLTNKTVSAANNTITGLADANLDAAAAIAGSKISPDFGNQIVKTTDGFQWEEGGYVSTLRAAQSGQTADIDWEMPADTGLSGQVMATNGSGRFFWTSVLGSSLNSAEVDIGSPGNSRTAVDTNALGDVLASTAGGLQIKAGAITASHLSGVTTTDLSEGTNLYYTQARFDAAFTAKDTDDLSEGTNKYYSSSLFDTDFAGKSTSNLAEGSNLYYTTARWDAKLAAADTDDLSEGTTNVYYTQGRFDSSFAATTTDSLSEGISNFYYSEGRFDSSLSGKSTSDLSEGTNLYYTDTRWDTKMAAADTDDLSEGSTNIYWTQARFDSAFAAKDTDDLTEGTNKFMKSHTGVWANADGTTKAITHNLGTTNVMVQVYDQTTAETILTDTTTRTNTNTVTLTASEAPAANWTVLIIAL
jgi:hypothetical protein